MAVKEAGPEKTQKKAKTKAQAAKTRSPEKRLKVKLVRSLIGRPKKQREVVRGLGLRKINSEVIREDCPEIWGMVKKIHHLVEVEILERK